MQEREDKTSQDLQAEADKAELDARDLEASEAFPIRVKKAPTEPTAEERAEHEILHEPYRSWCRACVAGRGRSDGHFARTNAEKQFPVIGIDYGYLKDKPSSEEDVLDEPDTQLVGGKPRPNPILCGRNSEDRWIFGYSLQAKGATQYGAQMLEEEIRRLGSGRIIIRSDQEPAILAHRDKSCDSCIVAVPGLLNLREVSSVGQSQSNGLAEGAVREVKAKFRSLRFCLEEALGSEIPSDHCVLAWLVQFACLCINVGRRYADGKTAFELRCGRSWKRSLCNFGERVMWLPSGKREGVDKADFCMEGIFLGVLIGAKSLTDDFLIGTPQGVHTARAVRRYPDCSQWKLADVLAVRGTPSCRETIVGTG